MTSAVICYLSIGSNLQDPHQQVRMALQKLSQLPSTTLLRCSPWYVSKAMGLDKKINHDQPDYINAVAAIETRLEPHDLLHALQQIELAQGRTREIRWGARTLDLDILLYGDMHIHSADLEIPHPRILERNFVLTPLADLYPALPLSLLGPTNPDAEKNETIASLLDKLPREGLRLLDEHFSHE